MHKAVLALVALTVLSSAFVFAEPAPVDVLTLGLIIALPVVGLVTFNAGLKAFLVMWMAIAGCHIASVMVSSHVGASLIHSMVSIYLFVAAVIFAAFVARRPEAHARLILNAYTAAALFAALTALIGYFNLLPGAAELFTKYSRGSGPFKDPNVFGAFLVPAVIYSLHMFLNGFGLKKAFSVGFLGLLTLGVLLSFSRGAWAATLIAILLYLSLSFLTAKYHRQQLTIVAMVLVGGVLATLGILVAAQSDAIGDLLAHRAQLVQAYDQGHEGRFGGQIKAIQLIISNPLGIGAQDFVPTYHSEEVHNVYLTMFLKAGWLGGGLFIILMGVTLISGMRHAFRRTATQPLFLVAFAALFAIVLEGVVIDSDHWRHMYLLLAVVWGLMLTDRRIQRRPRIIADRRQHLPKIPQMPRAATQPNRPARIHARATPNPVLFDVRGYSAYAYRRPRIVRVCH